MLRIFHLLCGTSRVSSPALNKRRKTLVSLSTWSWVITPQNEGHPLVWTQGFLVAVLAYMWWCVFEASVCIRQVTYWLDHIIYTGASLDDSIVVPASLR